MYRVSLVRGYKGREYILEKGDMVMLEVETNKTPSKEVAMVRTRHGRKVTVPRDILSKEIVKFTCQLCDTAQMNTYENYVMHMMDHHVRSQLVRGLDFSDGKLACPFKTCAHLH